MSEEQDRGDGHIAEALPISENQFWFLAGMGLMAAINLGFDALFWVLESQSASGGAIPL